MAIERDSMQNSDLDALFIAARKIPKFDNYTDSELKDKLINLMYSDSFSMSMLEADPSQLEALLDFEDQPSYDMDVSKRFQTKGFNRKIQLIGKKQETIKNYLEDIKNELIDEDNLSEILLQYFAEIESYADGDFWTFYEERDKEFAQFREAIQHQYYKLRTNIFVRFIDRLFGLQKGKLVQYDIYIHIPMPLVSPSQPIYGFNAEESMMHNSPWLNEFQGSVRLEKINNFDVDMLSEYSLLDIIRIFSFVFDEIMLDAELEGRSVATAGKRSNYNEIMFIHHLSAGFSRVLKVLFLIEKIQQEGNTLGHSLLRSGHVLYPLGWMYYKWLPELDRAYNEKINFSTEEGPTGALSVKDLFIKLKRVIARGEKKANLSPEKRRLLTESQERLKYHLQIYPQIQTHLKNRIKICMKHVVGDISKDFFLRQEILLEYLLEKSSKMHITTFTKFAPDQFHIEDGFSSGSEKGKRGDGQSSRSVDTDSGVTDVTAASSDPNLVDVMLFLDLQKILGNIVRSINACFSQENQLVHTKVEDDAKYNYLQGREYFSHGDSTQDMASFETIKNLQDLFDQLSEIHQTLQQVLEPYVKRQKFFITQDEAKPMKETITDISLIFRDVTELLKELNEQPEGFKQYAEQVKQFFNVNNKLVKKMLGR